MKKLTITILFAAILLCGCTHYYYVANVQNIPLFKEKNEYHFSGSYAGGDESECFEVQAAYSISDKIGIMANYMHAKGGNISRKDYGKGSYFDGAIGYYQPLTSKGVFEIYGGLGGSSQHHEYSSTHFEDWEWYRQYDGESDLSFIKLFIQPSIGLTFDIFDVGLSTRVCRISFTDIDNNIRETYLYDELNILSDKSHFFIEPAITFRGGWKYVKMQVQVGYSGYLNNPDLDFGEEFHLSTGLYFTIAKRYKLKND